MGTVISLAPSSLNYYDILNYIKHEGFDNHEIIVLRSEKEFQKTLGCDPSCIVVNYASWGALIGIAIYGVFAVFAALCNCNLLHYSTKITLGIALIGISFGAFIGGFMGCIVGLAEYEKDTHFYTQGIRMGEKLIVLRIEQTEIDKAIATLLQIGCTGVKSISQQGQLDLQGA